VTRAEVTSGAVTSAETTSGAVTSAEVKSAYCDRCGDSLEKEHSGCEAARRLEPPRFCPHCRRRMKVQVVPTGWSAACVEHGMVSG
jgi:NAD-dependent SIR2 family protein deacetylase